VRTGSRGEQSFGAGVPASYRRARPASAGGPRGCAQAHQTGWPSDRREPSSRLMRRASHSVGRSAKSWRAGESDRDKLVQRRAGGGRARTRKEATARESGCGSPGRESSLGRSRDASGMEQGREASGCHGTRRDPRGSRTRREHAESVERGKNPVDGTGEGLASFARLIQVSATAPVAHGSLGGTQRGTRRSCVRRGKNPRRGGPGFQNGSARACAGLAGDGTRAGVTRSNSEDEPNSRRGARGIRFASQARRGIPRGRSERRGGSAPSQRSTTRRARSLWRRR